MSKLRVRGFTISIDGYGAGPVQRREAPSGVGGETQHGWLRGTRKYQKLHGGGDQAGSEGVDEEFAACGFENVGAWIMGRNRFGPTRGPWADDGWEGWWGPTPPYHVPVFVLTHHPRVSIPTDGGTTFHFVADGIQSALERARDAARGQDVRLGGGVATVRQFPAAGLIYELHLAISPVLLGREAGSRPRLARPATSPPSSPAAAARCPRRAGGSTVDRSSASRAA